jgi:hypothetical protein
VQLKPRPGSRTPHRQPGFAHFRMLLLFDSNLTACNRSGGICVCVGQSVPADIPRQVIKHAHAYNCAGYPRTRGCGTSQPVRESRQQVADGQGRLPPSRHRVPLLPGSPRAGAGQISPILAKCACFFGFQSWCRCAHRSIGRLLMLGLYNVAQIWYRMARARSVSRRVPLLP